jgi:hypothetical protein
MMTFKEIEQIPWCANYVAYVTFSQKGLHKVY